MKFLLKVHNEQEHSMKQEKLTAFNCNATFQPCDYFELAGLEPFLQGFNNLDTLYLPYLQEAPTA